MHVWMHDANDGCLETNDGKKSHFHKERDKSVPSPLREDEMF